MPKPFRLLWLFLLRDVHVNVLPATASTPRVGAGVWRRPKELVDATDKYLFGGVMKEAAGGAAPKKAALCDVHPKFLEKKKKS